MTKTSVAFTLLFLIGVSAASAEEYLPLNSTVNGKELARVYRKDGSRPSREQAAIDKRACWLDPKEVSEGTMTKLNGLMSLDRDYAEREVLKAVIPCMSKKGWRFEFAK